MNRLILLGFAVVAVVGFALGWNFLGHHRCASQEAAETPRTPTQSFSLLPADIHADRETPALAADERGNVYLAWASQTGELERTLYLAQSSDGGTTFNTPIAVRRVPIHKQVRRMNGKERTFSTHVLPRLVLSGDGLYLGWVEAVDGGPRVEFCVARSSDGGKTFSEPGRVHGGEASRPGFTALTLGQDGRLVSAWLDGRNHGQQPFVSVSDASGMFASESLVYAGVEKGVCPCCDVAAARAADGTTLVALRDAAAGYRDIVVARSHASGFDAPVPVSNERWTFQGCPHDGPSLALVGSTAHVAWMDAHSGKRRVYIAESPLANLTFAAHELAPGQTGEQAHPRLLATADGAIHAVWDEGSEAASTHGKESAGHAHAAPTPGSSRAVMYGASHDGGKTFGSIRAVAPVPGAYQTQPALALGKDGTIHVAWSELSTEGKRIVCASVKKD